MTPTTPDHKPAPATDEEIAEWNPADRNIAAAVYPWKVAKLIARISADRAENAKLRARVAELISAMNGLLLSADASWEDSRDGHDWPEACQEARAALSKPEPASR